MVNEGALVATCGNGDGGVVVVVVVVGLTKTYANRGVH